MAVSAADSSQVQRSVTAKAARNLATTTKTVPQIISVTPRWLLHVLPWVTVEAGTYRVNQRKVVVPTEAGVTFLRPAGQPVLNAASLRQIVPLRELDEALLHAMSQRFTSKSYHRGETIIAEAQSCNELIIVVSGKIEITQTGLHGEQLQVAVLREGDTFDSMNVDGESRQVSVRTLTPAQIFILEKGKFDELLNEAPQFRAALDKRVGGRNGKPVNEEGEMDFRFRIHRGNGEGGSTPGSYVDYEESPREYPLSAVQSVVQIRTLVADLYNNPIDQLREQMRQAIESIKERQEWEIINNQEFGLLPSAARSMRIASRNGAPTPDALDDLLARVWKKPAFFLAHPKAIAAFGRECTSRGTNSPTINMFGSPFLTWRGVPLLPCDKLLVDEKAKSRSGGGTTNILLMRVGEKDQGVVGLHQPGIPHEHLPSLSVRFMGIDSDSIASYLISQYFSAAVLTPDALGVLENVEVGYYHDKQ